MKIKQYWVFYFCGAMSFFANAECLSEYEAKAMYLRAQGQSAADSEHLLKRSAVLCENYDVYYALGLNQQKLQQYSQSLEPLAKIQISQPYICEQFSFVFFKKIITPFFFGFICSWILFFSFF